MKRLSSKNLFTNNLGIKRSIVSVFIAIIYVIMSQIRLPLVNVHVASHIMNNTNFKMLQIISSLSGGNLSNFSILLVGLTPFIVIQMIIQILQTGISPQLKRLSEQTNGQRKINQIIKLATVPLTALQALLILITFDKVTNGKIFIHSNLMTILFLALIITTCTMIVIWLSDINTIFGVGNGISFIVSCSIIINIVQQFKSTSQLIKKLLINNFHNKELALIVIGMLIILILYIAFCIWFQNCNVAIPIQFAKLSSSIDKAGFLPFNLNVTNVLPIILSSTVMSILYTLHIMHGAFTKMVNFKTFDSIVFYALLLLIFTYICTFIQFQPNNIIERLSRENTYITGIDLLNANKSLTKILLKLASINYLFLLLVVILPMIIFKLINISETLSLISSSIIILITTETDIRRQLSGLYAKQHILKIFE